MSGYLANKTIFLAGATGLTGSSILEHVIAHCPTTRIRAAYRHTQPHIRHERIEYVQGDLASLEACRRMVRGCDGAVMAAAFTGGAGLTQSAPWRHIKDNLEMNIQMLEAFHLEGVRRVVYIGSATLYQDFAGFIKEEELDLNVDPSRAYAGFGWTVRFLERMCRFWHDQDGMEMVLLRCANIYGPYAKFDPKTSNFIPAIIRKAVDRMDPFEVWGSRDVVRDVLYAEDFARAVRMVLDAGSRICYDVFNLGSGVKTTVGEVVACALRHAEHRPSELQYSAHQPTTVPFRALDCSKIQKILGWHPEFSIDEGIGRTLTWWQQNRQWWCR
ncbi:MAG: NAD(P)-dependent oxidoreductase [Magnetococcales bacterium]|nr:NAD(P)-dependent oxidoreductase [Magnetococcales bacterium]